jgi:hypothetical protein
VPKQELILKEWNLSWEKVFYKDSETSTGVQVAWSQPVFQNLLAGLKSLCVRSILLQGSEQCLGHIQKYIAIDMPLYKGKTIAVNFSMEIAIQNWCTTHVECYVFLI